MNSSDCGSSGTPSPQAANAGEAMRAFSFSASSVRSFGREEGVDLEDAELAERRGLDLADQRAEIEVAAGTPGVLDQVREEHVLAARERVGGDPDEAEEARHRALDLVPQRLRLGRPTRAAARASEPITFNGTPADEPGV